ncbi:hypothetical protein GF324_01330, partial [bacterium]|nr:hypothetical protein [bacterium]
MHSSDGEKRKKIRIPPGDPFTYWNARARRAQQPPKQSRADPQRRGIRGLSSEQLRRRRNAYTFIMASLAFIALILYGGTQIAGPRLLVTVHGGDALVIMDGDTLGLAEETYGPLPIGEHTIRILSARPGMKAVPDCVRVYLG